MAVNRNDGARSAGSLGTLLKDLGEGTATLIRMEAKLAMVEVKALLKGIGEGTASVAAGGVLALLGVLSFFTGFILLPGDQWLRDRYWLGALIVTLLAGGIAAWFVKRGMALLSPAQLAPDQTVAQLKEDKQWLKQRLT
jgi:drug/metabolite transporter (DMT)-like permease